MIKIAIADDDVLLLKTFEEYFSNEDNLECVLACHDIDKLLVALKQRTHIDYLFLDIDFEGVSSINYISKIRRIRPNMDVIMFTQNTDEKNLFKAILAGASGFLPKSTGLEELRKYIRIILHDGAAITPQLAKKLIHHFQPTQNKVVPVDDLGQLSNLDVQILELLATGHTYSEIAEMVGISINGVRYHIKKIYKALHVDNKIDAIRKFQQS